MEENQSVIIRDNTIYVGKIIKKKDNLFDMPLVDKSYNVSIVDNITDTFGNLYSKSISFKYSDNNITFNAKKEYSRLKCTIAIEEGKSGGGVIQIESDQGVLYTSPEIVSTTEPYEIDIPINQASIITIKYIGILYHGAIVSNAILYNEE